jgi:methyl-accepting chemotaxis protein
MSEDETSEKVERKLQAFEESLDNLQTELVRHSDQIRALKEKHAKEIEELKEEIHELIDAVEDLATAKESVQRTSDAQEKALNRFHRRIEGLKQNFKD